jgi:hypothetical protein
MQFQLNEDNPEAVMVVLRRMYDIPYDQVVNQDFRLLQHHALVLVLAGKYRHQVLEVEAGEIMRTMINSYACTLQDFTQSLRIVFAAATRSTTVTACLVTACVANLRLLKRNAGFLSLLQEFPELGFEILRHQDLEDILPEAGEWEGE